MIPVGESCKEKGNAFSASAFFISHRLQKLNAFDASC